MYLFIFDYLNNIKYNYIYIVVLLYCIHLYCILFNYYKDPANTLCNLIINSLIYILVFHF